MGTVVGLERTSELKWVLRWGKISPGQVQFL